MGRGETNQALGDLDAAINDYEQALMLYPDAGIYGRQSEIYLEKNEFDKALDASNQALSLDDGSQTPLILQIRGRAYLGLNNHENAIEDFNRSYDMYPTALTLYYRGVAYHDSNQLELALADLERFLENADANDAVEIEDARTRLEMLK